MRTIKRIQAVDEMLLGIYGNRNVNYETKKVIINDDRIKRTLFSPTSSYNTRRLLELTFYNTDVIFDDKKDGENFALDKERVIANTVEYFRKIGIYIPEIVNSTERSLLCKWMGCAIIEHILLAIFSNISIEKEKGDIEIDDISLEFNKAVERIKTEFSSGDFLNGYMLTLRLLTLKNYMIQIFLKRNAIMLFLYARLMIFHFKNTSLFLPYTTLVLIIIKNSTQSL